MNSIQYLLPLNELHKNRTVQSSFHYRSTAPYSNENWAHTIYRVLPGIWLSRFYTDLSWNKLWFEKLRIFSIFTDFVSCFINSWRYDFQTTFFMWNDSKIYSEYYPSLRSFRLPGLLDPPEAWGFQCSLPAYFVAFASPVASSFFSTAVSSFAPLKVSNKWRCLFRDHPHHTKPHIFNYTLPFSSQTNDVNVSHMPNECDTTPEM